MHFPVSFLFMNTRSKTLLLLLLILIGHAKAGAQSKWEVQEAEYRDSSSKARLNFYIAAAKGNFFSDRKTALIYAEKGLVLAQKTDQLVETALLYNLTGVIKMYNEQYADADACFEKTLAIGRQLNNEDLLIRGYTNTALNSSRQGQYQRSILQNLQLIPLVERSGDEEGLADVYGNISAAYYYQELNAQSEKWALKALALFRKLGHAYGTANMLNTLSTIAADRKQYGLALQYAGDCLKIKKELKDSAGIGNLYLNLAELYNQLKNNAAKMDMLKKAETIFLSLGEEGSLAKVYANFGVYYADEKKYSLAAAYDEKAMALAQRTKDPYILKTLNENLSSTYAHLNDLDTALVLSKLALAAKDSLTNLTVSRQIAEMETKYETEKKERVISEQNGQLDKQQLQLKERQFALAKQQYTIWGLALLLAFLVLTGYLLYRKNKLQQVQKLQTALLQEREKAARTIIIAEEKERRRIAQDLHDGVGQMLSAIKMNLTAYDENSNKEAASGRTKLDRIIALVDDSCKEVRSVSHNMMPNALLKKSLASAVREFVDKLDHSNLRIHLYTKDLDEPLDANTETVLYRVIQECINNVIRHSGADTVDISIIRDQREVTATIEDNGKGFIPANATKGLGVENMKNRIGYLNGTINIDSSIGSGTVVSVHVPLQQNIS